MSAMPAIMLFAWPLVTLALFGLLGRSRGLVWATVVGYLLLPEDYGFDLPILPPYDKYNAIVLSLLLGFFLIKPLGEESPQKVLAEGKSRVLFFIFTVILIFSPFLTFLGNRSPILNNGQYLPGLSLSDVMAMATNFAIPLTTFFLARKVLVTEEHHKILLQSLVISGVVYAFLVLFEVRMSPQLNNWVYGYFPHSWIQHLRGGGFRPLVFLDHGLAVGFFLFMAAIAAFALFRGDRKTTGPLMLVSGLFIFGTLLLSKNLGAVLLAVVFLGVMLLGSLQTQMRVSIFSALFFLAYAIFRHQMPIDVFTDIVANYSPERALSLNYRLVNETALLERLQEKPFFGWGGWGRSQIYEDGYLVSVVDGTWIGVLSVYGWFGYVGFFGFLTTPLIFLREVSKRELLNQYTLALALIGAANLLYILPNSTLSPVNWLIFGALAGFIERDTQSMNKMEEGKVVEPKNSQIRYSVWGRQTL